MTAEDEEGRETSTSGLDEGNRHIEGKGCEIRGLPGSRTRLLDDESPELPSSNAAKLPSVVTGLCTRLLVDESPVSSASFEDTAKQSPID